MIDFLYEPSKGLPFLGILTTSIVYAGIGILGINIRIFSGIKPMPKPQKIIEQFCEPANKNTSNKSYSIISCGFSINLVHREIGDLAKDQRIATH